MVKSKNSQIRNSIKIQICNFKIIPILFIIYTNNYK